MSRRLLIVDDEEAIGSVLQDYFEQWDYEIQLAYNLKAARKSLKDNPLPDVLILDVMLPDGNGIDYLKELREGAKTRTLPVIVISAHATSVQNKIDGFQNGADEYMTKPFDLRELRARLERLLERKKAA